MLMVISIRTLMNRLMASLISSTITRTCKENCLKKIHKCTERKMLTVTET